MDKVGGWVGGLPEFLGDVAADNGENDTGEGAGGAEYAHEVALFRLGWVNNRWEGELRRGEEVGRVPVAACPAPC